MNITIEYGINNSLTKSFPEGSTYGTIINDSAVKAVLGYGSNVQTIVDGVAQPLTHQAANGDVILVQVQANTKAVLG
jgi:hypothetical protein